MMCMNYKFFVSKAEVKDQVFYCKWRAVFRRNVQRKAVSPLNPGAEQGRKCMDFEKNWVSFQKDLASILAGIFYCFFPLWLLFPVL